MKLRKHARSGRKSSTTTCGPCTPRTTRATLRKGVKELRTKGREEDAEKVLETFRRRFCDVSVWTKEVKQRFSKWLNKRRERRGTLWMEKFKSVLVELGEALRTMAL